MLRSAAALLLATPMLAACTANESCYDWGVYDSVERMHDDATLVVEAARIEPAGATSWSGARANVYDVVAAPVEPDGGVREMALELRVLSTPETCSGETYPDGDPMLGARDVRLYLFEEDDGTLRTLTPFQGVGSF